MELEKVAIYDLRHFFAANPPIRLIILMAIMAVMAVIAYILCAFLRRKLIDYVTSKQHAAKSAKTTALPAIDVTMFNAVVRNARNLLFLLILGWGVERLSMGPLFTETVRIIFIAVGTILAIRFVVSFVPFQMDVYCRHRGETLATSQTRSLMPIIRGVIWAIGLTFMADNLGLHVSTIIAGLGIVGVAVGLAGQAILADFFSYIVILLDKPFRIGDFIILANGKSGEVEYLGPKNARLRSLDDDLIVCSNSELTKNMVINQGSIRERVVTVEIGVAFTVPMPIVRKVPELLREVIESFPQCVFKRAVMASFSSSNYMFQLIYTVKSYPGGLEEFMQIQSDVSLAFTDKMNQAGMAGAYPTQSILFTDITPKKSQ